MVVQDRPGHTDLCVCLPLQARQEVLRLSSSDGVLKKELQQTAALSAALVADKRHLSHQLQEVSLLGSKVDPEPHPLRLAVYLFTDET